MATTEDDDVKKVILAKQKIKISSVLPANEHLSDFLAWLDDVRKKDLLGIDSGFELLNEYTLGLRGLMLLCSQPNIGKSTFCVNVAMSHLEKGGKVIYISLDMGTKDILSKFIQLVLKCDFYTLINKKKKDGKRWDDNGLATSDKIISKLKINNILDNLFLTSEFDSNLITEAINSNKNTLIIIDYLQAINLPILENLTDLSKADKQIELVSDLQKETGCPVLAIAEARKNTSKQESESWATSLSDIKGSGRLVYTPDMVFLLGNVKELDKTNTNSLVLSIEKVRDGGRQGKILYNFKYDYNSFEAVLEIWLVLGYLPQRVNFGN